MKALIAREPGKVEYIEVETPKAEKDMMLIKVERAGVCATDLSIYTGESSFVKSGEIKYPVRFGHEWSGVVVETGENVKDFKPGDRVYADNAVTCGKCPACEENRFDDCPEIRSVGTVNIWDGCFAEYMLMPERHVYRIPDNVSYDAAALIEPASIAYSAFEDIDINENTSVAVMGAGAIGLLVIWLAKSLGAGTVTIVGRDDEKLKRAKEMGADFVIDNRKSDVKEESMRLTEGKGFDIVIETSGSEILLADSFKIVKRNGTIPVLGFYEKLINNVPIDDIVLNFIKIKGVAGRFGNPQKVCEIMKNSNISLEPVISHRLPFERCSDYFENFDKYHKEKIKMMIEF